MTVCFCTLAIHAPYRQRARQLCASAAGVPWLVLTDEPSDFADLPVRAIRHAPTGPMAADYLAQLPATGAGRGAAAYHDKRFALQAALEEFDTAICVDADSQIAALPQLGSYPPGLAAVPNVQRSVAEHLDLVGTWRKPAFVDLARHLTGDASVLQAARWCPEACIAVTRDGREPAFFAAWSRAADYLQARKVYSGEGGVIGIAAALAGWQINFDALGTVAAAIRHEGGGPKQG